MRNNIQSGASGMIPKNSSKANSLLIWLAFLLTLIFIFLMYPVEGEISGKLAFENLNIDALNMTMNNTDVEFKCYAKVPSYMMWGLAG